MSRRTDNPNAGAMGTNPNSGDHCSGEERLLNVSSHTGKRVREDALFRQYVDVLTKSSRHAPG